MNTAVLPFTESAVAATLRLIPRYWQQPPAQRGVVAARGASHVRLHSGIEVTLRPIEANDAQALAALIARLSPAARRNRFHGAIHVSSDDTRRMCSVDRKREVAFVVTARMQGAHSGVECVVAEARYCTDGDGGAEFAVMVDERWQRQGLGGWAMAALRDAAQAAGLHWLHGEVLSSNLPMLGLMRCCGLCCTPDAEDDGLVQVQERLGLGTHAMPSSQPRTVVQKLQHWITR